MNRKVPPFNDLAQPNLSKEAKAIMEYAMQRSCEDQIRTLEESARLTCDYEATAVGGEES